LGDRGLCVLSAAKAGCQVSGLTTSVPHTAKRSAEYLLPRHRLLNILTER
jgi:hypothetical protein